MMDEACPKAVSCRFEAGLQGRLHGAGAASGDECGRVSGAFEGSCPPGTGAETGPGTEPTLGGIGQGADRPAKFRFSARSDRDGRADRPIESGLSVRWAGSFGPVDWSRHQSVPRKPHDKEPLHRRPACAVGGRVWRPPGPPHRPQGHQERLRGCTLAILAPLADRRSLSSPPIGGESGIAPTEACRRRYVLRGGDCRWLDAALVSGVPGPPPARSSGNGSQWDDDRQGRDGA